mmetsp:Transcript_62968/g.73288  ORF Transcript_62968/g.73288 Transcript_62968/m.73288 type:complete len:917 (+) Transcript_62968:72-2822(+)|eukprot:CAMPEP_0176437542 /NCGR_PEP_ID=MMETSP0127-20121128/18694_1 /TAXON_ID=938130 /ORGANISM="Platyophrya macrostoma, Strain WH" /LENGTH=916 /DNA_ID=CAMNT_0017821209 /DNA_START=56 /DNA_END=2806 /DNA_ORIENTATION=-
MKLADIFERHGYFAARNPCLMLIVATTIAVITNLGLLNINVESSPETLWVSPSSVASQNQQYFNEKYGAYYRVNQLIFRPKDTTVVDDLFQKHYLKQLYTIQTAIERGQVLHSGTNYSVSDLCYQPIPGAGCASQSPLEFWHVNYTILDEDPDIKDTATCIKTMFKEQLPCMSRFGIPVYKNVVLGKNDCADGTVNTPCSVCRPTAQALLVTFLLNNDKYTEDIALSWEKEVFEKVIDDYNAGNLTSPDHNDTIFTNITVTYMSQRSIPDELENQTKSNAAVVVISYSLMFLYIATVMGSFPNKVHSGFLLGFGGIVIVIISVTSSIGLLSFFGMGVSMISVEVVPFLILAIGVDNMFIISDTYKRMSGATIESKMSHALYDAGPSITAAAFCEFLAFTVGATTDIPALQGFCFNAGVAVIFNYIYQITAFVALFTLDEKRKAENRADCFFCIGVDEPSYPKESVIYKFMNNYYAPLLFTKACKIITGIIFFVLIIISIVGYNQLNLGLEQQTSVTEGSIIYNYFQDLSHYLAAGPEAFIVFKNVNWTDPDQLKVINSMVDEVSRFNRSVLPPVYSWVDNFHQTLTPNVAEPDREKICGCEGWNKLPFEQALRNYLQIGINSTCCRSYGICGMQYVKDFAFDPNGTLTTSRFRFFHSSTNTQDDFLNAYLGTSAIVDKYSKNLTNGASAFAFSLFYVYFEQYGYIKSVAFENLMLACGAIFGAVVLLKNPYSALFMFLITFLSAFDMLGILWLLNVIVGGYQVQINAVSVVNFITTAGLSVEFGIHIMLKYTTYKGTKEERARKALTSMGSSIVTGITLTKALGVSVLAFAPSTIFRLYYFRMYICLIFLGSFHGLVFLPLILSFFGPDTVHREKSYSIHQSFANDHNTFDPHQDISLVKGGHYDSVGDSSLKKSD